MGQVIEDSTLYNKDTKMNLGYLFLIYELCKKAGVPLISDEAWIHPIKGIAVMKNKPGVPRPEGIMTQATSLRIKMKQGLIKPWKRGKMKKEEK